MIKLAAENVRRWLNGGCSSWGVPEQSIRKLCDVAEAYEPQFDLVAHLHRMVKFSEKTFGPGPRTGGICEHIRKETREIEQKPYDLEEWIDVIILSLDGAWRAGYSPEDIVAMLEYKQGKNEARQWPDWRTVPQDKPIEHVRSEGNGAA